MAFMRRHIRKNIGQSMSEYAVLLAIVVAALIAMQVYIKRGLQGRIRDLAQQISDKQYEQDLTTSSYTTEQTGTTVQRYKQGVANIYQDGLFNSVPETVTRSGNETVIFDEVN